VANIGMSVSNTLYEKEFKPTLLAGDLGKDFGQLLSSMARCIIVSGLAYDTQST
jgi:hypothetical protein